MQNFQMTGLKLGVFPRRMNNLSPFLRYKTIESGHILGIMNEHGYADIFRATASKEDQIPYVGSIL